ncbi:ABC transporter permease [Kurthia massiliensis]|uniref:ABC transporter permease n=1 Tax=Kurthia massiliensis TaxID=1033739 RepID=UPI000288B029|nr:ABC transporter permease [Kurthia massiliensis]
MTLFSIAKKNVMRNFSQYFLYIASMIFSIVIYFTFVTLKYSDTVDKQIESSQKIGSLMTGASVILIFFVAIFIFYCNAFFMKKRKKEVALYALLGVRKRQIGFMLFFENLLLGCISLIAGIMIGFLASKGLLSILIHLMGYNVSAPFTFSIEAVINTAVVFFMIFLVTSLQGYRVIYKFKLIELFHAAAQGEKVLKPNPVVAAIGIMLIATGYFLALQDLFTSDIWRQIGYFVTPIIILFAVIIGTYLLFHSLTGTVLKLMKTSSQWLWKGLRVFTISQLLHRVRAQAKTLTVIAILSTTTITAGGAVYGLYYNTTSSVKQYDPNTYMYESNEKLDRKVNKIVGDAQFNRVVPVMTTTFNNDNIELEYTVMKQSEYNRLAKVHHRDAIHMKGNNSIILDASYDERFSPTYKGMKLAFENQTIHVQGYRPYNVLNVQMAYTTLVVSDELYDKMQTSKKVTPSQYRVIVDQDATKRDAKRIAALMEDGALSSQQLDIQSNIEGVGVLLFIGSFLGLVFLAATGSIIYFKILTEIEEDKMKYVMMHKLGVSMKKMRQTIAHQHFIVFFVPLAVALIHSIVALKAFSGLLMMDLTVPVCIWMAVYTIVYALFYVLTVVSSTKMIKQTIQTEG